jgi:hypothetical protein
MRRTPIRSVSRKRAAVNRVRAKVVRGITANGLTICPSPGCTRIADSPHEPLTRARGGSITDPKNIVMMCWPHNQELTLEPPWGYELGLLRHSWDAS